jgi:prolipoprotein diacylglyceryl transferase
MIYWNPDPDLIVIPLINHPIKWYGFFFVIGFLFGYYYVQNDFKKYTNNPLKLTDKLLWYILAGTIIGARLGHVLFYEPLSYLKHPLEILKIWNGGLASHGGTVGVALALWLFVHNNKKEYPGLTFLKVLDIVCIPTALVAFFIRLGNFFNQEIIGTPTDLPWAVIFGSPFDGSSIVPRHPSQLYEGLAYLATFFFLLYLKRKNLKPGALIGWFFTLVFTSRFFIEYTKEIQPAPIDQSILQMGQWLSLPFILLGLFLIFRRDTRTN